MFTPIVKVDNGLQMEVTQGIIEATKLEHAHDDYSGFTSSSSVFSSSSQMSVSAESSLTPNAQTHERNSVFRDETCPSKSGVQVTGNAISGAGDTSAEDGDIGAEIGNITTGVEYNIAEPRDNAVGAVDNQGEELRSPYPNHAKVSNGEIKILSNACMTSAYYPDWFSSLNAFLKAETESCRQNQTVFEEHAEAKSPLSYTAISLEEARNACDQATALSLHKPSSEEAIERASKVLNEGVVRARLSNAFISTASAGAQSGLTNRGQQGVSS